MTATIGIEPAEVPAGKPFVLTVTAVGDVKVVFGKDMRMRPVQGPPSSKDAHTYWLVGSLYPETNHPTYFGPGVPRSGTDEGYTPMHHLTFRVPPVALAQDYRLTLSVAMQGLTDAEISMTVAETPLRVI